VLPYKKARDEEDEAHIHPLQLDVIERCLVLWSNENESVLSPFMGVGSEVYGAVRLGRRGIGVELKEAYYQQAVRNIEAAMTSWSDDAGHQQELEFRRDKERAS
jgi:DNA modification methylase